MGDQNDEQPYDIGENFDPSPPAAGPTPPPAPGGTPPPPPPPPPGAWGDDVPARSGPTLRPMTIGEVIDAGVRLYRENWQVLAGIVALFVVPLEIMFGIVASSESTAGLLVVSLVQLLLGPLLGGAVAKAAADTYLGSTPDISSTLNFALGRFGALIAVAILTVLAVGLGFLALVIPGIILLVRLYFGSVVVVIEGVSATKGLRRSYDLTGGNFWRLVGAAFVIGIITTVVSSIIQLPLVLAAPESIALTTFAGTVAQIVVAPFSAVTAVLLYFDLRVRKEAFDLQILAQQLHQPDTPGATW